MTEQTEVYEISAEPVEQMSTDAVVAEYDFLRTRIAEDRWNRSYEGRMQSRKTTLEGRLAHLFVEQEKKKTETTGEQKNG